MLTQQIREAVVRHDTDQHLDLVITEVAHEWWQMPERPPLGLTFLDNVPISKRMLALIVLQLHRACHRSSPRHRREARHNEAHLDDAREPREH